MITKSLRKGTVILLVVAMLFALGAVNLSFARDVPNPEGAAFSSANEKVDVLIGFYQAPGSTERDLVRAHNGEIYREFTIVNVIAASMAQQAADALTKNPKVRYVELDGPVYALETAVASEIKTVPWGIDRIFGDEEYPFETWNESTGKGIGVAVLDTGIDKDHIDLVVADGVNFSRSNRGSFDYEYYDVHGHGTHVAGTVAALNNEFDAGLDDLDYIVGAASAVDLYAVKVLDDRARGTISSIVAGIEWAVDSDIPVLNMSLGTSSDSTTLSDACDDAYAAGHLLVAAAGNSGNEAGTGENVIYPAKYDSVMAVAASDNNDQRAEFSSTGSEVELIAPGVNVWSTWPNDDYHEGSGTSMASPHVAGVAALGWALDGSLSNNELRAFLQATAEDLDLEQKHQGYGLVRADRAVAAIAEEIEEVHDVEVTAFEVTGEVLQGEDVDIEADFENTGDFDETVNIVVKNMVTEEVFHEVSNRELKVGEIYQVEETWPTDEETKIGKHDILAWIEAVDEKGEPLAEDERTETVIVNEPKHEIAIIEFEGDTVEQGETAEIEVVMKNEGDYDYTGDDYVKLTVTNECLDETLDEKLLKLESGESHSGTVLWETDEDTEAKDYEIKAVVEAFEDGNIVADDIKTTTVTVLEVMENTPPEVITFEVEDTSNPVWARVEIEWEVYDEEGLLDVVILKILDEEGYTTTEKTIDVIGTEASGVDEFRERDAHENFYEAKIEVYDEEGEKDTDSQIVGD